MVPVVARVTSAAKAVAAVCVGLTPLAALDSAAKAVAAVCVELAALEPPTTALAATPLPTRRDAVHVPVPPQECPIGCAIVALVRVHRHSPLWGAARGASRARRVTSTVRWSEVLPGKNARATGTPSDATMADTLVAFLPRSVGLCPMQSRP